MNNNNNKQQPVQRQFRHIHFWAILLSRFAAAEQSGNKLSFSDLAREFSLTQSAISTHIKNLEETLGFKVIHRPSRGRPNGAAAGCHQLTANAKEVLPLFQNIIAVAQQIQQQTALVAESDSGHNNNKG